jgi:hypothetical protein
MIPLEEPEELPGQEVRDKDGETIGTVEQVWTDAEGRGAWAVVGAGFMGLKPAPVPLENAEQQDDALVVPFDKKQVENAPMADPLVDEPLTPEEVDRLHEHYGLDEPAESPSN